MLVVGAFADAADVDFTSHSEVGRLPPERGVTGSGAAGRHLWPRGRRPVQHRPGDRTRNLGLFFHETIALAERFDVTASGRFT